MKTTGIRQLFQLLALGAVACTLHAPVPSAAAGGPGTDSGGTLGSSSAGKDGAGTPEASAGARDNVPPDTTRGGAGSSGGSAGSGSGGLSGAAGEQGEAGMDDGATCTPACDPSATCQAGECVCPSKQKLCSDACVDVASDPDNCGGCGKKCSDGCSAGRCFTSLRHGNATHSGRPERLAMNAQYIYYTTGSEASLCRIPRAGGAVQELATGQSNAGPVVLDATNVYWASTGDISNNGAIYKTPLAGGDSVELATQEPSPEVIAIDASYVYWADYQGPLMKVPIAGGTPSQVTTDASAQDARNLIIDGANLYWSSLLDGGSIWGMTLPNGTPGSLASGLPGAFNYDWMAKSGSNLYFLQVATTPQLSKIPLSGGAVASLTSVQGFAMTADDSAVYVGGANADNAILKVSLDGKKVSTLAYDARLYRMYVDGNDVFWTTLDGDLKATAKTP